MWGSPGESCARHSSADFCTGYDIFCEEEELVPKSAPRPKGMESEERSGGKP